LEDALCVARFIGLIEFWHKERTASPRFLLFADRKLLSLGAERDALPAREAKGEE